MGAYAGTTTVYGYSCVLGGRNGSLTNSDVWLMPTLKSTFDASLVFDNSVFTNNDRFSDVRTVRSTTLGQVVMYGNASNNVCSETLGGVWLESGILILQNDYRGTNTELVVNSLTRQPGTGLLAYYYQRAGNQNIGVASKIRMLGESVNTNGIWRPWAIQRGAPQYLRVDANGCLIPWVTADYLVLPTSGSLATGVYRTASANLALTATQEVYGLRMEYTGNQVLDLGANDLTIGCGTLLVAQSGAKTINSSGGRLVFGGNEIRLGVQLGTTGSSNVTIRAPIAITGAGSGYLVLPHVDYCDFVLLDGVDQVGSYAGVTAVMRTVAGATLRLGGPSDRTINGPLAGVFGLVKLGPGTLRLNGPDMRFSGSGGASMEVQGGRVVLGHATALVYSVKVRSGGRLDVASGTTWNGGFTVYEGGTFGGSGKFGANPTLTNGVHVAPGESVGTLTTGNLTLPNGAFIDWELGGSTNVAGVGYDLLYVGGNFVLPGPTSNMVLTVSDTSAGTTRANGARFTVANWTGNNPFTNQTWSVSNATPRTLDTSTAIVQVSTADKKIYLSGLKTVTPRGTVLLYR